MDRLTASEQVWNVGESDLDAILEFVLEFAASEQALAELAAKGLLPPVFEAPSTRDWPLDEEGEDPQVGSEPSV